MEKADKKIRVAIYCRVATDTDNGQGLEMQKEQLRRYAEEQGFDIVGMVAEVAKGNTLARPGLRELHGLARNHSMDKVLAVNMERFGRNPEDVLRLENKLKKTAGAAGYAAGKSTAGLPENDEGLSLQAQGII